MRSCSKLPGVIISPIIRIYFGHVIESNAYREVILLALSSIIRVWFLAFQRLHMNQKWYVCDHTKPIFILYSTFETINCKALFTCFKVINKNNKTGLASVIATTFSLVLLCTVEIATLTCNSITLSTKGDYKKNSAPAGNEEHLGHAVFHYFRRLWSRTCFAFCSRK